MCVISGCKSNNYKLNTLNKAFKNECLLYEILVAKNIMQNCHAAMKWEKISTKDVSIQR